MGIKNSSLNAEARVRVTQVANGSVALNNAVNASFFASKRGFVIRSVSYFNLTNGALTIGAGHTANFGVSGNANAYGSVDISLTATTIPAQDQTNDPPATDGWVTIPVNIVIPRGGAVLFNQSTLGGSSAGNVAITAEIEMLDKDMKTLPYV